MNEIHGMRDSEVIMRVSNAWNKEIKSEKRERKREKERKKERERKEMHAKKRL